MTKAWQVGESMPRREDRALLRGEAPFLHALIPADAAVLAMVRSPLPHARLRGVDTAACAAVPGFLLALTAADLPAALRLSCVDTTGTSADAFLPVLARDRVRYVGEPVIAIVATDAASAAVAAEAVRLDLDPLPAVAGIAAAIADGAPPLHGTSNVVHRLDQLAGDPDRAFAEAHTVIEETFRFHRVGATALELRCAVVGYDPATGELTIRATSQVPGAMADFVAEALGLPRERIRPVPVALGGGFGAKEQVYPEEALVALAAYRLGRTVAWRETRQEAFRATMQAREGEARVRMAVTADGIVTALELDAASDIGAGYGLAGNTPGATIGGMLRGPYRIPHFRARTVSVATNKTPLNVYRGAGHPQAVFAMERMMDLAAARLGLDRAEIRRRNLIPADAFPLDRGVAYPGAGRVIYDSGDYPRVFEETLEAIGYRDFPARRAAHEVENPTERLGLGLSFVVELSGVAPGENVALSVDADGIIHVASGMVAVGQGTDSALVQLVSATLGIPADDIEVETGAAGIVGAGTFASRGIAVAGSAAMLAGDALKQAAIALAADIWSLDPPTVAWIDGALQLGPGRNEPVTLASLHAAARAAGLDPAARLAAAREFRPEGVAYANGCHAAVVAVDIDTGAVRVLDYAVTHDCGTVLSPKGVEGQIVGGAMQGLGATLFEHLPYSAAGVPLAGRLMDYPLPVAADAPRFHLRHIATPSPLNPLGAKGAGEGGFSGAPGAIVNAIADALSGFGAIPLDDGPWTPPRIHNLIAAAQPPGGSHPAAL